MAELKAIYTVAGSSPAPCPGTAHIIACIQGADDDATCEAALSELEALIAQLATLRKVIDDQGKLFGRIRKLAEMEVLEQKG